MLKLNSILKMFLIDARGHCGAIISQGNPEAIHDFRVTLRRFRVWAQNFNGSLYEPIHNGQLDELTAIAKATNLLRDLDVHTEIMGSLKLEHTIPNIKNFYNAQRALQLNSLRQTYCPHFYLVADHIERIIDGMKNQLSPGLWDFNQAYSATVIVAAIKLREKILSIHGVRDRSSAHKARIAAKTLRYLLETTTESGPDRGQFLHQIKHLQNALGLLQDQHTLVQRAKEMFAGADKLPETDNFVGKLSELANSHIHQHYKAVVEKWQPWARDEFSAFITKI